MTLKRLVTIALNGYDLARRDKIGRTYFSRLLPLDGFGVIEGRLVFEDLAVRYGLAKPRQYRIRWFAFDNLEHGMTPLRREGAGLPGAAAAAGSREYFAAEIRADDPRKIVIAYLCHRNGGFDVVGIDRHW